MPHIRSLVYVLRATTMGKVKSKKPVKSHLSPHSPNSQTRW